MTSAPAPASATWSARILLLVILVFAALLRLGAWPARYEMRDIDEPGYCEGGLALFEGILPAYKNAPGGPVFWTGWLVNGFDFAGNLVSPRPDERALPFQVRVFAVMERTLMDNYHDLSHIRQVLLTLNFLLGIAAIYAAYRYGMYRAGTAGAVAAALLVGAIPLFVEFGAMSRPYSMSWSFGILAIAAAGTLGINKPTPWRARLAWLFLGLAIGTRIECILLLPFVIWEFLDRPAEQSAWKIIPKLIAGSLVTAIVLSPWMPVAFFGMLRAVATIQVATTADRQVSFFQTLKSAAFEQGLGLVMIGAFVAIWSHFRRAGFKVAHLLFAAYILLLWLSTFKSTGFGLHHKGPQVVGLVMASLPALLLLPQVQRWPLHIGVGLLVGLWPAAVASAQIYRLREVKASPSALPVLWVEKNIPAGTRVYVGPMIRTIMPTPEAADRAWATLISPDAYKKKLESGMKRFAVSGDSRGIPRAMSEENVVQERGNRRRWFILGGYAPDAVRYDVEPRTSLVFPPTDLYTAFAGADVPAVLVVRPGIDGLPPEGFPPPYIRFAAPLGMDTLIYVSPDLKDKLGASQAEARTNP